MLPDDDRTLSGTISGQPTPEEIRDLLVNWYHECFKVDHSEAKRRMGMTVSDQRIYESAVNAVKLAAKRRPTPIQADPRVAETSPRIRDYPREAPQSRAPPQVKCKKPREDLRGRASVRITSVSSVLRKPTAEGA
jgi:hypothetical protein